MKNSIDLKELKTIYDADSLRQDYEGSCDLSTSGGKCPEFLFHEKTATVKFLDKSHNMIDFSVSEFNEFIDMVKKGEIGKINLLLRGEKEYVVGNVRFVKGGSSDRIVVTSPNGDMANMAVKHFNVFVDAVLEGKMQKLSESKIKVR